MGNSESKNNLKIILDDSSDLSLNQLRDLLNNMSSSEIAHALESSPPKQRKLLFSLLETNEEGDVLADLGEEIQQDLVSNISNEELTEAVKELELDEIVDILQNLPEERMKTVLSKMSLRDRNRIELGLIYPDNTAGGLLNTDVISVRPSHTIDVVITYLRDQDVLPENTDKIFVVTTDDQYIGEISISKIITSALNLTVEEVMEKGVDPILVNQDDREVATIFERNDLISSAVINDSGELLGRITIDDVVDVIRDEAEHSMLSLAGLSEDEDTFAPVKKSVHRRSLWLGVNLITAFLAAGVIGLFDTTIEKQVALAILMPIVASMGGVAGSQTLTLVIRSMALGQLNEKNQRWLMRKEILVGASNGLIWAVAIAVVTILWFNSIALGILIGTAIVINLIAAALAGVAIPLLLKKFGSDPALSAGVLLTTVTDVVGFVAFLGFATLFIV